jgi:hypothetical protein
LRTGATPQSIAQEYDRDPTGTQSMYFSVARLKELQRTSAMRPMIVGNIAFDPETYEPRFMADGNGPLKFWLPADLTGQPCIWGDFVIGCDVAHGLGGSHGSNSAAVAFNRQTGEQVAEMVTRHMRPSQFARWCVAFAKYLNNAQLNWEANGPPGAGFTHGIVETRYMRVYYREVTEQVSRKKTKKMGWWRDANDKRRGLGGVEGGGLREAISQYIIDEFGKTLHSRAKNPSENASGGEAHGDRVIAAAVAWVCLKDRKPSKIQQVRNPAPGSLAWRRKHQKKERVSF